MARLLVSVRSAAEAREAVSGGADVIDVKDPGRGPLGRADLAVWSAVREAVPARTPVSVALGELTEWLGPEGRAPALPADAFRAITYRKIGLAGCDGLDWTGGWARLRNRYQGGPPWVAVVYADWSRARAPHPDHVLSAALDAIDCEGVLFDTWNKSTPSPIDLSYRPWFERARRGGRFTALAGRIGLPDIARLADLRPDILAVRGAACSGGDRLATIDAARVAALARAAASL